MDNVNGQIANEEVVSFKEWMITLLIMLIPVVNIVMMFVWAFGSGAKKSKANYFKAALLFSLIMIVLSFIFSSIITAALLSMNLS